MKAFELTECFTEALVAPIFRMNYFSCIWLFFTVIKEFLEILIRSFLNLFLIFCSSVVQSCLTLWDSMDCSTQIFLSFVISLSLLKLMSIELVMPFRHLILFVPFSSCPQSLQASGSFPVSQLFARVGQSIGVSASASVLPMNTQDWSPLGWTGWVSNGLSRVFSSTTVWKHQFFDTQPS